MTRIDIDFVTINASGEWLAFAASKFGQLLVWDWQSESYILKQQGHLDFINALTFSPDGQRIVTAGDDGKLKVWDLQSGFCVVTLTEHSSGVTACEFAKKGNVLFTSSLDGSIRAWDLIRYRNFRTFTGPSRLSFSSLAVDPSGEVVCAASLDSFDIHVWSVQTGQLLDRLAGHEAPISALAFAPFGGVVVSGSWDHTVRLWNIFSRTQSSEPLQLHADVLRVAVRPDGKQVAVSTLDGQLTFWSVSEAAQEISVDGRRDVSGGRKLTDRRTAANVAGTKAFTSLAYSTDGSCVIAGGNSKYICLYDVQSGVLVRKFVVSINLSIDGTQEFLNSRNLTEGGPMGLIDVQGEASDLEDRIDRTLPGANRGNMSMKRRRPEVRVPALAFSPTGGVFCAATTEGLLVYSTDKALSFDPFDLGMDTTPKTALEALAAKDYVRALAIAFRLNEEPLMDRIYESIPPDDVALVVRTLPPPHVIHLLRLVMRVSEKNQHLELNFRWMKTLLSTHGPSMRNQPAAFLPHLRTAQKVVTKYQMELARMTEDNVHAIDYLLLQPCKGG
jgi:periodic tryptophan protein 2